MKPEDRKWGSPREVTLRDGRSITIRLMDKTDAEAMIVFYADIPEEDGIFPNRRLESVCHFVEGQRKAQVRDREAE